MNEIMYTQEGIAWGYKPLTESDPVKVAEAERRFNDLFERLEKSIEKDRLFPQTV
ncbi:hypothetical protein EauS123_00007 [Exiguobacterium phage vB_EauS-123]|nr:hypothetical protein EauS123_00007 [Exiguobacterium phage vB_EauS-123]